MSKNKSKTSSKTAKSTPTTNSKKWLIAGASVLGATTIAFGSLFSCAGGGGGGSYKPGTEVKVQAAVSDPTGGQYKVTFGSEEEKAIVGQKYHGTITLTPKNEVTQECYLPEKLVSVISNTTVLKEENYTYTLGATRMTATLDIPADYVYGPVVINLALVTPSEPGPEPGPTPEPINWVDTDEEGIIPIRDNIMIAHNGVSPLTYLPSMLGGHQFKLEVVFSGGKLNDANELRAGSYDIDTDALYIKRTYGDKMVNEDNVEYMTYHVDETSPLKTGVYRCYGAAEKTNDFMYTAESLDRGIKLFTNLNADDDVADYADAIYATERYEPVDAEKRDFSDITCVEDYLYFIMNELEQTTPPEVKYQKGNDLSLKITSDFGPIPFMETNVEAHLELLIENGITKHSLYVVQAVDDSNEKTDVARIETTLTPAEEPFTPDDLSEYFAE